MSSLLHLGLLAIRKQYKITHGYDNRLYAGVRHRDVYNHCTIFLFS